MKANGSEALLLVDIGQTKSGRKSPISVVLFCSLILISLRHAYERRSLSFGIIALIVRRAATAARPPGPNNVSSKYHFAPPQSA